VRRLRFYDALALLAVTAVLHGVEERPFEAGVTAGMDISGTGNLCLGNLCLTSCSASKRFPSHAALGQHQRRCPDSRQMSGSRSPLRRR
jgi:hypothetical protein